MLILLVCVMLALTIVMRSRRSISRDRLERHNFAHLIDVNTADAASLHLLPGIGPRLARRVTEHRVRHGSFQSIEHLDEVNGIGRHTIRHLRPFVTASARPNGGVAEQ